jgi:hypothetical protein
MRRKRVSDKYRATVIIQREDGSNRVEYEGELLEYSVSREAVETYSPGPWKEFAPGPIVRLELSFWANEMMQQ